MQECKHYINESLCVSGDSLKSSVGYMTSAVLVGLLDHDSGCSPNLINVLSMAKDSGIMVGLHRHLQENTEQYSNTAKFLLCVCVCCVIVQINQTHCATDGAANGACKVEIMANGCSYEATGTVQGGVPVLLELSGSVFRQPVALSGNLLFFKALASPQLLSSVAGKTPAGFTDLSLSNWLLFSRSGIVLTMT